MQSSGAEEKSNYLSAYSLGGEEGCGERRGRNEKEKGGKEIGHIKEVYLPAIYSVKSWPIPLTAVAFVTLLRHPETHSASQRVRTIFSKCLKCI